MIKIHLAIGKEENIPCMEFKNVTDVVDFIDDIEERFKDRVWLLTNGAGDYLENSEIIVSENLQFISSTLMDLSDFYTEFFLQEYATYESAYAVSLDMREGNKLCYDE